MDYSKLGLSVITDFITPEEEEEILSSIKAGKNNKGHSRNTIKRYGSDAPYKSNMASKNIPAFLESISDKIMAHGLLKVKPNSITINEYFMGQGINAHIDSVASGDVITVLSLKGTAKMKFTLGKQSFEIDYPPRCLVQMRDEIRYKWMHSVPPVRETRYSIVFRKSPTKS